MRTKLSALPIPERDREMMIAHAPPDLIKTYDLHNYRKEKPDGFELWHVYLRDILQQGGGNVVALHG